MVLGIIGAAASAVGQAAGGMAMGAVKGHQQRKFARETREWNLTQQNSAYQRSVEDMKLAGLNPTVMFGSGGGGKPAGGGMESGATDPGGPLGIDVASAYEKQKTDRATQKTQTEQQGLIRDQAASARAQKELHDATKLKTDAETRYIDRTGPVADIQGKAGQVALDAVSGFEAWWQKDHPTEEGVPPLLRLPPDQLPRALRGGALEAARKAYWEWRMNR